MSGFDRDLFATLLELAKGNRSINQYAMHAGVSSAHISRLLRRMLTTPPESATIRKFAEKAYNGITYEDLMRAAGHLENSDPASLTHLPTGIFTKENGELYRYGRMAPIPILRRITSSFPDYEEESKIGDEFIPAENIGPDQLIYFIVPDDNLTGSRIYPGDKALVQVTPDIKSRDIAVVIINGQEAVLRRVFKLEGQLLLQPDNPKYQPIIYDQEQVKIIGKVIRVIFEP